MFLEPGLLAFSETGHAINGEAHWSVKYFQREARPHDPRKGMTRKRHNLPWPLNKSPGR